MLIACAVSAPRPAAAAWPLPSRSVAPAVEEDQESASQAETHFASGHRLYQLGRYEEAVAELRRGYELRAEPRFLREIAECYRELGVNDQALFYYDRYLATAPDAPDRKQVEARAADLEALLAPPPPPPNGLRRPVLILEAPPKPAPPPPRPWQRWWFWTAVGAAVAAGVTAAVLATGSGAGPPITALGDRRFY